MCSFIDHGDNLLGQAIMVMAIMVIAIMVALAIMVLGDDDRDILSRASNLTAMVVLTMITMMMNGN